MVAGRKGGASRRGGGEAPARTWREKDFVDWFREDVLGLDTEEYRRAFWREAYRTGGTIGRTPRTMDGLVRRLAGHPGAEPGVFLFLVVVVGGASLAFWLLRRELDRYIRRTRRPTYYDEERRRRRLLAESRRAVMVRRTANPRPTLEAVRAAYACRNDSPVAALRLGGLLEDLECFVDSRLCFARGTGRICGREGGIKRLLEAEAPDLYRHYKTLMSYKARARKYRQACDVRDPVPADALLPALPEEPATRTCGGVAFPLRAELEREERLRIWMSEHGYAAMPVVGGPFPLAAPECTLRDDCRELAAEILRGTEGTHVSLDAQIALKIDPDCVAPDAKSDPRVRMFAPGRAQAPGRPRVSERVLAYIRRRRLRSA